MPERFYSEVFFTKGRYIKCMMYEVAYGLSLVPKSQTLNDI